MSGNLPIGQRKALKTRLEDIAELLAEYRDARARAQVLKGEMMKIAVEELGMTQQDAKDRPIEVFLDGYLVGQGMQQSWRNIK